MDHRENTSGLKQDALYMNHGYGCSLLFRYGIQIRDSRGSYGGVRLPVQWSGDVPARLAL